MALLYAPQKKQKTTQKVVAEIQDLDYQGLGVAKVQGKTWFIENALPTEKVEAVVTDEKRQYGLISELSHNVVIMGVVVDAKASIFLWKCSVKRKRKPFFLD